MEVVVPVREFCMESETTSPYVSAPSSPRLFAGAAPDDDDDNLFEFELELQSPRRSSNNNNNPFDLRFHYCSAPSSPTRAAALFAHFSAHGGGGGGGGGGGEGFVPRPSSFSTASMVPFDWEEKPGTPKARFSSSSSAAAEEFAFDFEARGPPPELASADELFDRGRIRPLKPPPRLQQLAAADDRSSPASSPRSPRIRALLSPRRRRRGGGGDDFDPFVAAMAEATKERGRDSSFAPSRSRSRKGSRSLSPLRVGVVGGRSDPFGNPFEPNPNSNHPSPSPPPLPNTTSSSSSSSSSSSTSTTTSSSSSSSSSSTSTTTNTTKKVGKRWRLSDLLLFRSASDGRITTNRIKDRPTFKYSPMSIFSPSPSTVSPSPSPSKVSGEKNDSISKSTNRDDRSTNGVEEDTKKKRASFAAPVHFFSRLRSNPVVNRFSRGFTNSG